MSFNGRCSTGIATLVLIVSLSGCAGGDKSVEQSPTAGATTGTLSADPSAEQLTTAATQGGDLSSKLEALEGKFSARVGVSALDTETGVSVTYRGDERFGYASTLKVFAATETLRQFPVDDREALVRWTEEDIEAAGYSPATREYLNEGLSVAELAEVSVRQSDNTAMNLILERIGGPTGLDEALNKLGDEGTNVVDTEPDLNIIKPGSTDNTATPSAFTNNLAAVLDSGALSERDVTVLLGWMSDNRTGDTLIRAGAPEGWIVRDKSGGSGSIRNDLAVIDRADGGRIILTIFTVKNDSDDEYDDALVAQAAAAVLTTF